MNRTAQRVARRLLTLGILLPLTSSGCAWMSRHFGASAGVEVSAIALSLDDQNWCAGDLYKSEGDHVQVVATRCDDGSILVRVQSRDEHMCAEGVTFTIREAVFGERIITPEIWAWFDGAPDREPSWSGKDLAGRVWISEDKLTTGESARIDYALIGRGGHDLGSASARGAVTFVVP